MIRFFRTIIYIPLYNFLVLLLHIPGIDVGIATVILTVIVKLILYPLSKKTVITQIKMREKEGELKEIKKKYSDPQVQAVKTMEFYKTNNINPFSGILTLFIQIPIIYSLYYIFFRSGLPVINESILYSFVKAPAEVSMRFLGLFDMSERSIVLSFLAALATYIQMHLSTGPTKKDDSSNQDFSKIMMSQMKFTMPVIVFLISWRISGVVALYWLVSNVVGILQDIYTKKTLKTSPQS